MYDRYNRNIDYMRISVTDRCNLRCRYCMPEDIQSVSMSEILTYEEIIRVIKASVSLGIINYRITGGEPLVRRGVEKLAAMIKSVPGVKTLTLTTNGVALAEYAEALKAAGLDGINVSLDTVDPAEYEKITGRAELAQVMAGIERAVSQEIPVKLNAVTGVVRDYKDLILFTDQHGLILRFIEMMPIGYGRAYAKGGSNELFAYLEECYGKAEPLHKYECDYGTGPAVYYRFPKLHQPLGFIMAVNNKFCDSCNRVRLTSDGRLKPCLCYEDGTDLREILRSEADDKKLEAVIKEAVLEKRLEHCFGKPELITEEKSMVQIGG
jgi:cyclic pyranopterin phosphate synthase